MKVSAEDVKHIAQLSRLTVPASEMEVFTEQFNQILNYADILEKIPRNNLLKFLNLHNQEILPYGIKIKLNQIEFN